MPELWTLGRHTHVTMNEPREAAFEVSFPKSLLLSAVCMASFVIAGLTLGLPFDDPLFVVFFVVMVVGMTFVFAVCLCFMLRCKISHDGLCPAVPTFYQQVLRWEDISVVRGFASPFYVVRRSAFGPFCILPRRFFLKRPDSLKQLLEQYAPADNIVRKKLAA